MKITYYTDAQITAEAVAELFKSSGIRRPVDDVDRIQRMIDNANLTITAWDGRKLVGIARALSDSSFCCYLSDLAVHADYQRKGIGKELVAKVRESIGDEVMLLLLSAPAAMDYYPKIGFEKIDNAFLIQRER